MTPSGCPVTSGFPIRRSPDQCVFDHSPGLIAACHVLLRLSTPRHPPCTLSSLTTLMRGQHQPRNRPALESSYLSTSTLKVPARRFRSRPPIVPSITRQQPIRPEAKPTGRVNRWYPLVSTYSACRSLFARAVRPKRGRHEPKEPGRHVHLFDCQRASLRNQYRGRRKPQPEPGKDTGY